MLRDCRTEVDDLARRGKMWVLYDAYANCQILHSTYREVLRMKEIGPSVEAAKWIEWLGALSRLVVGHEMNRPIQTQINNIKAWGPTAGQFMHRRFLCSPDTPAMTIDAAYWLGTGLVPGRHQVGPEILSLVALLVLYVDMNSSTEDGQWGLPTERRPIWSSIVVPVGLHDVDAYPRRHSPGGVYEWSDDEIDEAGDYNSDADYGSDDDRPVTS